jgi:hypothetical protein
MVDVHVVGDTRSADRLLDGLEAAMSEQAITYNFLQDRVYPILEQRARERFAAEGGEEVGGAWAALQPYTIEDRVSKGFGAGPINVRTGEMKRHILDRPPEVYPHTLGGTLYFPKRGGSATALEKVETAQMGKREGNAYTPARPVLGVSEYDMALILVAFGVHLRENQLGGGMGTF